MFQTSKRILLIDDEEAVREVTKATLEILAGWNVALAGSGSEGIAIAAATAPDAILLDVMMPGMDGPRTLEHLQSNAATQGIPVVFLTAKAQEADVQRLRALGVKSVILKPFDPAGLAAEVAAALGWSGISNLKS